LLERLLTQQLAPLQVQHGRVGVSYNYLCEIKLGTQVYWTKFPSSELRMMRSQHQVISNKMLNEPPSINCTPVKRSEGETADVEEMRSVLNALQGMAVDP
jgi:hypothetical protein